MAERKPLKRQREEEEKRVEEEEVQRKPQPPPTEEEEEPKRLKASPYNQILSLLEDAEEQDGNDQDLTSLISTLQQELSSAEPSESNAGSDPNTARLSSSSSCGSSCDDEDTETVMRRLLEASDDELGIPSCGYGGQNVGGGTDNVNTDFDRELVPGDENGLGGFGPLCDGLWELEDEAANYYTLLQSELFL